MGVRFLIGQRLPKPPHHHLPLQRPAISEGQRNLPITFSKPPGPPPPPATSRRSGHCDLSLPSTLVVGTSPVLLLTPPRECSAVQWSSRSILEHQTSGDRCLHCRQTRTPTPLHSIQALIHSRRILLCLLKISGLEP